MLLQYSGMNGEKIYALIGLFLDDFEDCFVVYVLDVSVLYNLVDWHCSKRHEAPGQKLAADVVKIAACT